MLMKLINGLISIGSVVMTYDEAFEILVKDGTIHEPPYDAIFDLVDAILD